MRGDGGLLVKLSDWEDIEATVRARGNCLDSIAALSEHPLEMTVCFRGDELAGCSNPDPGPKRIVAAVITEQLKIELKDLEDELRKFGIEIDN